MLAMFLSALDQTIVATALATIGRAYADVESLAWIVTAYLLAATAVTPLYGKLSDIHGRRPVLLGGIAIFVAGSVACALAPSMPALIAARALQGIGGGGLIALSQTIVGDAVSPRERGRYQGYFGAVFAVASIAGPVLGGVFAEHLHWSMIFWINLPLGLARLRDHRPRAEGAAAPRAQARPRPARRRPDGDRHRHPAARAQLGRRALRLDLAAHRRPHRRRARSVRAVRLAPDGRARAVRAALDHAPTAWSPTRSAAPRSPTAP